MTPTGSQIAKEHSSRKARSGWRILVITGDAGAGKTTTCRRLAAGAEDRGWRVAGVICPARFEKGVKTGILATDLRSGDTRLLAVHQRTSDPEALGYSFDEEALTWANDIVAAAPPCDLLIVDELGPLELVQGRGFTSAFQTLQEGKYQLAIVVVRPSLLEAFGAKVGLPFAICAVKGVSYETADPGGDPLTWFEEYLRG